MHSGVTNRNVYFGLVHIANEALTPGIKKWLGVLGLRPSLEDFPVVQDNSAVRRRKFVTLFLLVGGFLVIGILFPLVQNLEL